MTTQHPTTIHAACYGIGCPRHATCQLYAQVEQTSADDTLGTCDWQGDGKWPLFALATAGVALMPEEAPAC